MSRAYAAVRRTESGERHAGTRHRQHLAHQVAFRPADTGVNFTHLARHGQPVYMPMQGLVGAQVPGQPRAQPAGTIRTTAIHITPGSKNLPRKPVNIECDRYRQRDLQDVGPAFLRKIVRLHLYLPRAAAVNIRSYSSHIRSSE